MVLMSTSGIGRHFGYAPVLDRVSVEVMEGQRIGVVGPNGSGKSTLLKLLARLDTPDQGSVTWRRGLTVGYVPQLAEDLPQGTVREVIEESFRTALAWLDELERITHAMAKASAQEMDTLGRQYERCLAALEESGSYEVRSRVDGVMHAFGFEALADVSMERLSGGERTKVALARALVREPDCLILDEPTNHLDLGALEWLEDTLRRHAGAVILVSHDRYFLDQVATHIWEVEDASLTPYTGGYSQYVEERERRLLQEFEQYQQQQQRIAQMEAAIRRLRDWANRSKPPSDALHRRASSIQKALDRMVRLEKPKMERPLMDLELNAGERSGDRVVEWRGVSRSFDGRPVLTHVDWQVREGDRIGLVGQNGAGKSTMVKLLLGDLEADSGEMRRGPSVRIGVLHQAIWDPGSDPTERVIDRFRAKVPMEAGKARHVLARFLFYGDHVFRPVGTLSGGEQMRLRLAQLMHQDINTLVLDEPTNHLDIASREVLEEILDEFRGTVVMISHDRYFLNRRAQLIDWLEDGQLTRYEGGYDAVRIQRSAWRRDERR